MNYSCLTLLLFLLLFSSGCGEKTNNVIVPDPSTELSSDEMEAMMRRQAEVPDDSEMQIQQAMRAERMGGN
ncbi:hypothetical protein SAMN06265222_1284 [Neorhodopirellula lusitana]|uniref:Secreted protein n=1 Tax=Neorhodopirellula lusitana TaxID=445327 RepID=A0ABY1QS33_9BACT|nr:hypothetical protein [Neorhodopirellula lusitana]SMP78829.1 hypothetical protein SAMN06265222_1284 [Neorhodopirellula lusitana]